MDDNFAETLENMSQDQTAPVLSMSGPAKTPKNMANGLMSPGDTTWAVDWESFDCYTSTAFTQSPSLFFSEIFVPIHRAPLPEPVPCLGISETLVIFEIAPTQLVTSSPISLGRNTPSVPATTLTFDLPTIETASTLGKFSRCSRAKTAPLSPKT